MLLYFATGLVFAAAVTLAVAIVLVSSRATKRSLAGAAACAAAGAALSFVVAKPVYNDEPPDPSAVVVYLGITDEAVVSGVRGWVERRYPVKQTAKTTVIGLPEAESMVRSNWPGARFAPSAFHTPFGVTLEALIPDLEARCAVPTGPPAVVIAGPRALNMNEVRNRLGQVFERHPTLPRRLHFLSPGVPDELPAVGGLTLTAARVLARGSPNWPVGVRATSGGLSGPVYARGWLYDPSLPPGREIRGVELQSKSMVLYETKDPPQTVIPPGATLSSSGLLSPPRSTSPAALMIELRTEFEPLLATTTFVTEARPQLLVLKKKLGPDLDPVYEYCRGLGLDVRRVELDLSTPAQAATNAKELADYPVLLVGIPLDASEWAVLRGSVAAQQAASSLLFVGSGRIPSKPAGWLEDVLTEFKPLMRDGVLRKVGFAWDNSGSMGDRISDRDPRARFTVIQEVINQFKLGFNQRNTGLLEVLVDDWKPDANRIDFKMLPLGDIATEFKWGVLEAGPALVEFSRRVVSEKYPLSDVIIFMDPTDVEDDGLFSQQHLDAAQRLENAGCTIHLVSVGGEIDGRNNQFFKDRVRLRMTDHAGADLNLAIERLLYTRVLPRLTTRYELAGGAGLEPGQRAQLERVAGNPELKLIDALGGPADIRQVDSQLRQHVLVWAVYKGDVGTPLLMRRPVKLTAQLTIPVTWLNTSINAEAAQRLEQDDGNEAKRQRTAIANLFIAAVSCANNRLKPSPFNFYSAPDGQVLVAVLDTYQPFQLVAGQSRVISAARGVSGVLDDRDLGQLRWAISTRIEPYSSEVFEVQLSDKDPRIGSGTQAVRIFGLPPTLVPPREFESITLLSKQDVAGIPPNAESGAGRTGIPRSWYGVVVSLSLIVTALLVWRL
jgi:hypothetical protein